MPKKTEEPREAGGASSRKSPPATRNAGATPKGTGGPGYPIESVDNVLRLLLLIEARKQVRVSEVSSELGIAVSTAHRLLAMLAHHGFVRQDPDTKVYHLGSVLVRLGLRAVRDMDLRSYVRPYLEKLREQCGETVHLAVPQGDEVLYVDCVESLNALRVSSRVGTSMWAHCTSVGKACLACEPEDRLRTLYPNPRLPALTKHSITSRAQLFTELEEVRRLGYANNANESEEGVGSVSAAVRDRSGVAVGGISVSVPLVRLTEKALAQIIEAVTQTVKTIEAALP